MTARAATRHILQTQHGRQKSVVRWQRILPSPGLHQVARSLKWKLELPAPNGLLKHTASKRHKRSSRLFQHHPSRAWPPGKLGFMPLFFIAQRKRLYVWHPSHHNDERFDVYNDGVKVASGYPERRKATPRHPRTALDHAGYTASAAATSSASIAKGRPALAAPRSPQDRRIKIKGQGQNGQTVTAEPSQATRSHAATAGQYPGAPPSPNKQTGKSRNTLYRNRYQWKTRKSIIQYVIRFDFPTLNIPTLSRNVQVEENGTRFLTEPTILYEGSLISLSRYTRLRRRQVSHSTPGCSSSPGLPQVMRTARPKYEPNESNATKARSLTGESKPDDLGLDPAADEQNPSENS